MSITSITAASAFRPAGATPAPIPPVQPVRAPVPLAPAVQVDIRNQEAGRAPDRTEREPARPDDAPVPAEAMQPRVRIDRDTKAVVYQEVDPASGDVVVQLPDPVVLKTRAYAEAAEARARSATHPLDRTA